MAAASLSDLALSADEMQTVMKALADARKSKGKSPAGKCSAKPKKKQPWSSNWFDPTAKKILLSFLLHWDPKTPIKSYADLNGHFAPLLIGKITDYETGNPLTSKGLRKMINQLFATVATAVGHQNKGQGKTNFQLLSSCEGKFQESCAVCFSADGTMARPCGQCGNAVCTDCFKKLKLINEHRCPYCRCNAETCLANALP